MPRRSSGSDVDGLKRSLRLRWQSALRLWESAVREHGRESSEAARAGRDAEIALAELSREGMRTGKWTGPVL